MKNLRFTGPTKKERLRGDADLQLVRLVVLWDNKGAIKNRNGNSLETRRGH